MLGLGCARPAKSASCDAVHVAYVSKFGRELIKDMGVVFRSGPGGQDSGRKWTH